jgi:putative DNA primase/helicase
MGAPAKPLLIESRRSVMAEQALLGALLLDCSSFTRVAEIITSADLSRHDHRLIFSAVAALYKKSTPADVATVAELLETRGNLNAAGGYSYLLSLANNTPGTANITAYADIVREHSLRNALATLGKEITNESTSAKNVAEVLARIEKDLAQVQARQTNRHTSDGLTLIKGSELRPEPIRWLWNEWLARGKLHILAGSPGTGKTTIATALAATVTAAGRWPDGSRCEAGNVVIWSGEDDPKDTLLPRLLAQGADPNRVFFVGDVSSNGKKRPFDPAKDFSELLAVTERIGGVRLLLVDPVVNAVTGDGHKNTDVRRALQPLVDLCTLLDVAALGITHFTKGTAGREPIERVTGSIAFGALARLVFVTAKTSNDGEQETRLLARAKSNIGPDGGGFYYEIRQRELRDHPGVFASSVLWGDVVEGSARELLGEIETLDNGGRRSELDAATEWLSELLSKGPMPTRDIKQHATDAGISWATIRRAQAALRIEPSKTDFGGGWEWALPRPASNHTDQGAHHEYMSTFADDEHLGENPVMAPTAQDAHMGILGTSEHLRVSQELIPQGAQDAHSMKEEPVEDPEPDDSMEEIDL